MPDTFSLTNALLQIAQIALDATSPDGIRMPNDDPKAEVLRLRGELNETRAALRDLCETWGCNDWDDDLHLADVVEKHLGRALPEPPGG